MKKTPVKLLIDFLLSLTFVLLFNTRVPGLPFHEVAGIGIGFGILVHILLNIQWVKKVTLRLFDTKLPGKTRLGYVHNLLLLIAFILIIVSGLFISKVLFPNLRVGNQAMFRTLHISISYLTLILVGIHIGLHWNWVISIFKNLFKLESSKVTGIVAKLSIIILLLFGGSQIVTTNFTAQITSIGNVFSFQQQFQGKSDNQTSDIQLRPRDRGPGDGGPRDGGPRGGGPGFNHQKGQFQSLGLLGILSIIIRYSGIMGIFAILTYYIDKFLTRRKNNLIN